jgi:hypothetical protein
MGIKALTLKGDKQIVGLHCSAVSVNTLDKQARLPHHSAAGQPLV